MNGQEVIASLQVEDGIAAGVTKEYVLSITLPASIEQIDSYIVKVALGNDVQMDSFQPAFNDLQLEVEEVDDKYEMTITNNGNVETNANLVIYDQETDGTELAHYSLGQLACGEEVEKSFAKDELLQLGETLCVNVENPQEELLESNNKTYLYVGGDIVQSLDHLAATKTKVVYKTGEKLNLDDVILYPVYEDGEEVEVTGYTTNVQDIDMSKAGKKKLTLVYEENYVVRTVSFDITVEENVPKENGENKPDSSNTPVAVGNTNVPISVNTGNTETAADVSSMIFPKVKGVKVKTKKRARILIQWKKIKNVSRYQIQIAPNKKFKKSVKTKNVRKCKYIWKKLKKGKTYYVRIRVCANGKYGPWTKVKKVKVK